MVLELPVSIQNIDDSRLLAQGIVQQVHHCLAGHSTVGLERGILRLLGFEGTDREGIPLASRIVLGLQERDRLERGALYSLGAVAVEGNRSVLEAAKALAEGGAVAPDPPTEGIRSWAQDQARIIHTRIASVRSDREARLERLPPPPPPWLYLIVATGNIQEDVVQACLGAGQGADIVAVIRSTAQSLMDHVPEGLTSEGYGGTFATQANFRLMRERLDEASETLGRYVRLTNYASGLCMVEMAALGALERVDMMLSDSMYGILFRDINMRRTLVDQHAARRIQGLAGITINTGEDNYLTTSDAFEAAHTVLASHFINEAFALRSGLTEELIGLGHAFEMDPDQEDGLLLQMADALLVRQCFPGAPLKYMPPTRYMDGNIFQGHVMDALFNLTSIATGQCIHLVGILTEGIHNPFLHDRYLSLQNARYVHRNARHMRQELSIAPGGAMARRACEVQARALVLLQQISEAGLFRSLSQGVFGGISRNPEGGRGLDGVFAVHPDYQDPLHLLMGGEPC